jgi:hypothetical protein
VEQLLARSRLMFSSYNSNSSILFIPREQAIARLE